MMSQNGGGAGKSVSTTTNSNSPHPRCATDHPMKQGKGIRSNGVIVKFNNGEFLILPDCNTCHYMNQNIQFLFPFITLDGRRRRSGSRTAEDIIMTQGGLTQLLPLTIIGIVIEGKQGTRE